MKKAFVNAKNATTGWLPGMVTSENLGDYSYTLDSSSTSKLFGSGAMSLLQETKDRLQEFLNYGWSMSP